jgi:hypothetical protein
LLNHKEEDLMVKECIYILKENNNK